MVVAHIAGIPVEETLLSLGGPAAIYLVAVGAAVVVRNARLRLGALRRDHPEVDV
jgi:hypothetical protein